MYSKCFLPFDKHNYFVFNNTRLYGHDDTLLDLIYYYEKHCISVRLNDWEKGKNYSINCYGVIAVNVVGDELWGHDPSIDCIQVFPGSYCNDDNNRIIESDENERKENDNIIELIISVKSGDSISILCESVRSTKAVYDNEKTVSLLRADRWYEKRLTIQKLINDLNNGFIADSIVWRDYKIKLLRNNRGIYYATIFIDDGSKAFVFFDTQLKIKKILFDNSLNEDEKKVLLEVDK